MNPFDILKPPSGAPDDPMAMQSAMTGRPVSEIFADVLDKPQISDAMSSMFDPMSGEQALSYDPDAGQSIPWADGRGDGMGMTPMGNPNTMEQGDALEQAYLQSAQRERDVSEETQDRVAQMNIEEDNASRRKMGL